MKETKQEIDGTDNTQISGDNNTIHKGKTTYNYTGLSREDLVAMLEERFHHMLSKEAQMDAMFTQIQKFGDEIIRQNADFRMYNASFAKQAERIAELNKTIAELTNKLLENKINN